MKITSDVFISNSSPLVLCAGPCVIENETITDAIAEHIVKLSRKLNMPSIFKASYDKANRTSLSSFRGAGIKKGMAILQKIKMKYGIPILTDVHCVADVKTVARTCDIIQIPAFLCRQTDLLIAAGKTGKTINIKKGQFIAPEDMRNVIKKVESTGNKRIMITERGSCFGYHNLVVDMRSFEILKSFGYPVIFDATHSVQIPGGKGSASGGERQFIEPLSKAAVAIGIAGVFFETHPHPDKALSDGPNSLPLISLEPLIKKLLRIDRVVKQIGRFQ